MSEDKTKTTLETKTKKPKKKWSRRRILAGGAVVVTAGVIASKKPSDASKPITPYFTDLSAALKRAGIAQPTLIVDRARLRKNISLLSSGINPDMGYRIVTKSLPSLNLINEVTSLAKTDRMMMFNIPFMVLMAKQAKYTNMLLGKPMPVAACADFYAQVPEALSGNSVDVQWLIDTQERLAQYGTLAASLNQVFKVNLEIDVGLHRGGFSDEAELAGALTVIKVNPNLEFSGFMGYEAHLSAVPTAFGMYDREKEFVFDTYKKSNKIAQQILGSEFDPKKLTLNVGGSHTFNLYKDVNFANEISAGSVLVKPTHFDTETLSGFEQSSFIASPVLKVSKGLNIPSIEKVSKLISFWDPNQRQTIFTYGGNWMADSVSPAGLTPSSFSRSSNQEMLNGSSKINIKPDDFVFLRPHQSEAVFTQFGNIAVYEDGEITGSWPVFPAAP